MRKTRIILVSLLCFLVLALTAVALIAAPAEPVMANAPVLEQVGPVLVVASPAPELTAITAVEDSWAPILATVDIELLVVLSALTLMIIVGVAIVLSRRSTSNENSAQAGRSPHCKII